MNNAHLINIKKEFYCRCCLLTDVHLTDMSLREFHSENQNLTYYSAYIYLFQSTYKVPAIWENMSICDNCSDNLKIAYTFRKVCQNTISIPEAKLFDLPVRCCCVCSTDKYLIDMIKLERFKDAELHNLITEFFGHLEAGGSKVCRECLALYEQARNFLELCWQSNKNLSEMWSDQGEVIKVEEPNTSVYTVMFVQGEVKQEAEEIIEDIHYDEHSTHSEPQPVVRKRRRPFKSKIEPPKSKKRSFTKEPDEKEPSQPFFYKSRFACECCSEVFKFRKHYLIHMESHQEFSHQCPDCTEVFTNRFDLNKHLSLHQLDKTQRIFAPGHPKIDIRTNVPTGNQCSECLRCFPFTLDLEIHLYQVHRLLMEANLTGFPFLEYPDELRQELKILRLNENAERRYECVKCDSKFCLRSAIKTHVLTVHSKAKQFPCPHCELSYKAKYSLMHHLKKHTEGEKSQSFKPDPY
jgi:hypothetical protein